VIAAVGPEVPADPNAEVIDGVGLTLLPGLIDAHVHAWGPVAKVLERNLLFGVTTALEMQCDGDGLAEVLAIRAADPPDAAQLLSSGFAVTVPGGHGTEYGFDVPTVEQPKDAQSFVDARIAEGSDYIKVMHGDARRGLSVMNTDLLQAAIDAAHVRGKKVAVHIRSARCAREAIEAGADFLAHIFADQAAPELGRVAAEHGIAVIPTLSVIKHAMTNTSGAEFAQDERIAPFLTSFDRRNLAWTVAGLHAQLGQTTPQDVPRSGGAYAPHMGINVRALRDAGVPILAGTDAPNPGLAHGASLHQELELLVEAGLMATEALSSATSVPADRFGLNDRGRIARGLRADLLLVRGNPADDITCTRDIVGVWKAGVRFDRESRIRR
jgi:imidazolonepropionase-like amidohydrolase